MIDRRALPSSIEMRWSALVALDETPGPDAVLDVLDRVCARIGLSDEQRWFRMIGKPWARTLTGGSTGGWEALAQQVFYPTLYGGAWSLCPDPVDFRYHQLVSVYSAHNAYFTPYEWEQVSRPSAREVPGDTIWTMEQENHWELALGTNGRSQLGQWDIWQAVYGPQGADGYPSPIWDKVTGAIDHAVAKEWHPMDIRWYLNKHWSSLGPKLAGKIKVWVGDDDTFFLNDAVELLQDFLGGVRNPAARAEFHYGKNKPHCFGPYGAKLVRMMANAMAANAPAGANTAAWHRPPRRGPGGEPDERGGVRAESLRPVAVSDLSR